MGIPTWQMVRHPRDDRAEVDRAVQRRPWHVCQVVGLFIQIVSEINDPRACPWHHEYVSFSRGHTESPHALAEDRERWFSRRLLRWRRKLVAEQVSECRACPAI